MYPPRNEIRSRGPYFIFTQNERWDIISFLKWIKVWKNKFRIMRRDIISFLKWMKVSKKKFTSANREKMMFLSIALRVICLFSFFFFLIVLSFCSALGHDKLMNYVMRECECAESRSTGVWLRKEFDVDEFVHEQARTKKNRKGKLFTQPCSTSHFVAHSVGHSCVGSGAFAKWTALTEHCV